MPDSLQADWVKIQILETLTDSMNFIKTLIAVAVSMVTDFKNMLPAESYSKHSYGDMKLKILKRKCEHNEAQFVSKTMNNAFRAFEEKYLRKLALCFYVNEYHKNKLIEFHVFEFKYYGEGITKDICSENRDSLTILKEDALEEVQERAMYFIKAWMAVAQMCQDTLPANYGMSVQLSYNDSAPEDYQAPGYCRGADHIASKYHEAVKLAGVKTPFHRLVARSYKLDVGCNRGTYIIASHNPPVMTQDLMDDEPMDAAPAGLRCPCNNGSGDPGLLLTCEHCGTRQHAACFGVQSAAARRHCCERCADTDVTRQPTDTLLASLQRRPDMRESLCLFRRALWLCARRGEVGIDTLVVEFGLTSLAATKLMKALHSHDVFELRDKADALSPQKINMAQMHVAINKFFKSEESDLVERLVFESLSQEKPDLVGSALTPTERASLRAPASIVAVASPASCSPLDPTLHRYQEALAATSPPDEDLPLFYHSAQLPKSNKRKNNQSDIEKSGAKIPRRAWNSD